MARTDIADGTTIDGHEKVPWRTHTGLLLKLPGRSEAWWHRHLDLPKPLPLVLPPKKAPDPKSKRSKKKEAAQQKRLAELPEELREEFNVLEPPQTNTQHT
eukprot:9206547-Pyramimonas_sp.AAC.1